MNDISDVLKRAKEKQQAGLIQEKMQAHNMAAMIQKRILEAHEAGIKKGIISGANASIHFLKQADQSTLKAPGDWAKDLIEEHHRLLRIAFPGIKIGEEKNESEPTV